MAVPELSDDARRAALEKAAAARRVRAALKQQLRDGELTLEEVVRRGRDPRTEEDIVLSKTKVSAVLESIPRIGKKTARRTMELLDTSESRRLRGLGDKQTERLLEAFDGKRPTF